MVSESVFQKKVLDRIRQEFEGCVILKNDPNYLQGFPDWTILYKDRWAVLEMKEDENSPKRPNQEYYITLTHSMSFGRFVYPQNEEEVLDGLQQAFRSN